MSDLVPCPLRPVLIALEMCAPLTAAKVVKNGNFGINRVGKNCD